MPPRGCPALRPSGPKRDAPGLHERRAGRFPRSGRRRTCQRSSGWRGPFPPATRARPRAEQSPGQRVAGKRIEQEPILTNAASGGAGNAATPFGASATGVGRRLRRQQVLGASGRFACHHGETGSHGLVHDQPPFLAQAWQYEGVRQGVEGRGFVNLTKPVEMHTRRLRADESGWRVSWSGFTVVVNWQAQLRGETSQARLFLSRPDQNQVGLLDLAGIKIFPVCAKERGEVLLGNEAAEAEEVMFGQGMPAPDIHRPGPECTGTGGKVIVIHGVVAGEDAGLRQSQRGGIAFLRLSADQRGIKQSDEPALDPGAGDARGGGAGMAFSHHHSPNADGFGGEQGGERLFRRIARQEADGDVEFPQYPAHPEKTVRNDNCSVTEFGQRVTRSRCWSVRRH